MMFVPHTINTHHTQQTPSHTTNTHPPTEPTLVFLTFLLISAASLIPLMNGGDAKDEKFGPFQPGAEMLNGRAAMLGMASLLIIEAVRGGQALF